MADRLSREQRRKNMQAVKSSNSGIEKLLRKELWRRGHRYRINYRAIEGKPDIVFTKHKIAIFCDSEFWHGYEWETRRDEIRSNRDFWLSKIERNIARDTEVNNMLRTQGWIVLRFWGNDIVRSLDRCVCAIEASLSDKVANQD